MANAGSHGGDGGPRQIRGWHDPFGLPAMQPDERAHVCLANKLLLFTVSLALELLAWVAFFLMEHPGIPDHAKSRDLATIWETGPLRVLRSHQDVKMITLMQGHLGAKSPKPTAFLVKSLPTLQGRLDEFGTLPLPRALKLGKTKGTYHTAALKEYPWRLCAAIGAAVRDFAIGLADPLDQTTEYNLINEERCSWGKEILQHQNMSAMMGADRAGAGQ